MISCLQLKVPVTNGELIVPVIALSHYITTA